MDSNIPFVPFAKGDDPLSLDLIDYASLEAEYRNLKKGITNNYLSGERLKINEKLPKIYLDNVDTFINWYNTDLKHEDDMPHAFEEGYFTLSYNILDKEKYRDEYRSLIKKLMNKDGIEFIQSKYLVNLVVEKFENITLYFKFKKEDLYLKLFDKNNIFLTECTSKLGPTSKITERLIKVGEDGKTCEIRNPTEDIGLDKIWDVDSYLELFGMAIRYVTCIFGATMWYLATTKNLKQYIYDNSKPLPTSLDKVIKEPKTNKVISTPIYNISNIRRIKVDTLIKHRKGWTYSHSFQVHGHYRHYKNGKVVFIKSYIKCKDRDYQQQNIIVKPKD